MYIFRMRHVSFARSHTVTSFDNVSLKSANSSKSLERLIDGRKTPEPVCPVESPKIIVLGIYKQYSDNLKKPYNIIILNSYYY